MNGRMRNVLHLSRYLRLGKQIKKRLARRLGADRSGRASEMGAGRTTGTQNSARWQWLSVSAHSFPFTDRSSTLLFHGLFSLTLLTLNPTISFYNYYSFGQSGPVLATSRIVLTGGVRWFFSFFTAYECTPDVTARAASAADNFETTCANYAERNVKRLLSESTIWARVITVSNAISRKRLKRNFLENSPPPLTRRGLKIT